MRRSGISAVFIVLLLTLVGVSPADALTMRQTWDEKGHVSGNGCESQTESLTAPHEAYPVSGVAPLHPRIGDVIYDQVSYMEAAKVTAIEVDRYKVTWTVTGSGESCAQNLSWSADFPMEIEYRQRFPLDTRNARSATEDALHYRFSDWYYLMESASKYRIRCRGRDPKWRCDVVAGIDLIGSSSEDFAYVGRTLVKAQPGRTYNPDFVVPKFVVRFRVWRIDYFCISGPDKPRSECIEKRYRGSKTIRPEFFL